MSDVPVWRLFAYMDDDEDGEQDESRRLADWQVQDVVRWCTTRGFDHIYLCRVPGETRRFQRAPTPTGVTHRMRLVEGSHGLEREDGDSAA